MAKQEIKVDDIVFFKPYETGCYGRVVRIGTKTDLGMLFIQEDGEQFYELETIHKKNQEDNNVFTRTSIKWLTKVC